MQSKNLCSCTIIGGTYTEVCNSEATKDLYGSGLRALHLFQLLNKDVALKFKTCCDYNAVLLKAKYSDLNTLIETNKQKDITFEYENPLSVAAIYPRPDFWYNRKLTIKAQDQNVLVFGMLEADFKVEAEKIVYDPQTNVSPLSFKDTNSKAKQFVLCINASEARTISKKKNIQAQKKYIFEHEKCNTLIIKNGAWGAYVFTSASDEGVKIPVYKTTHVHAIGTGDIFTAFFAYEWFKGTGIVEAARKASMAVACYAEKGKISDVAEGIKHFDLEPLNINGFGQIYLAGPFFSLTQRWLYYKFFNALRQDGVTIFSPFFDVGVGNDDNITKMDLEGIDKSAVMLAILDGIDAGTMFEIGYAVAKKKQVVCFIQNVSETDLQMLKSPYCTIESDFTTAVYKTIWYASK